MIQVHLSYNEMHIMTAQSIREFVFIKEQGIPKHIELDGKDTTSRHLIALYNFEPVGCARLQLLDGKFKFDKFAVLDNFRNMGIGKELVKSVIDHAQSENVSEVYIDIPTKLVKYLSNFGFKKRNSNISDSKNDKIQMYYEMISES